MRRQSLKNSRHRIPETARQALWVRCRGRCEYGGEPLDPKGWDAHHRKQRSLGGEDTLQNLVAVCRKHHDRIHQANRYDNGWLVRSHEDPLAVPVTMHDGRHYLGPQGQVQPLCPAPAPEV